MGLIGSPETHMRGPSTTPAATAFFRAMMTGVDAPTSRMLVKPASSVLRAETVDSMASSSLVRVTASRMGSPACQVAVM